MAPNITDRPAVEGYGIPTDLDGVLPWTWAHERLSRSRCYWLATANAEGRPHAMPVWGVWLDDPEGFFFSCAPGARKARNLAANPAATITAESTREVVSVEGTATSLESGSDQEQAGQAFLAKYRDEMPEMTEDEATAFVAESASFLIRPERAFGVIETPEDFGPSATRWRW
jgi:nitroimidazol reductase NimA-like FMN-containing flavoprotein (pyridoxamine 5'-phosphate oxidase superfamily)